MPGRPFPRERVRVPSFGPILGYPDTWQLVVNTSTTIITFLRVFLIQNTQNRDAAAIHLKPDGLPRAVGEAPAVEALQLTQTRTPGDGGEETARVNRVRMERPEHEDGAAKAA